MAYPIPRSGQGLSSDEFSSPAFARALMIWRYSLLGKREQWPAWLGDDDDRDAPTRMSGDSDWAQIDAGRITLARLKLMISRIAGARATMAGLAWAMTKIAMPPHA